MTSPGTASGTTEARTAQDPALDEDGAAAAPTPLRAGEAVAGAGARRLSPRQARRIRALTATVALVAVGIAMVLQLRSQPSLVTLGLYGAALTISGTAIMLSRIGRTRVAMAVLSLAVLLVGVVDPALR
ncbi:hypothetical protein ACFQLX_05070 [Streptomyces polyrhachis]|uniref:Uncharacterized protein n=1 Tax=Streptomyces polyrhachis TaxID=1282885 RepID=A0ABW2GD96_9ACTN